MFDWDAFAARVSFRPGPRFTLEVRRRLEDRVDLVLKLETTDVNTGLTTTITHEMEAPNASCDKHAYHIVRGMAIDALTHEIDEALLIDGMQQRDPHVRRRPV